MRIFLPLLVVGLLAIPALARPFQGATLFLDDGNDQRLLVVEEVFTFAPDGLKDFLTQSSQQVFVMQDDIVEQLARALGAADERMAEAPRRWNSLPASAGDLDDDEYAGQLAASSSISYEAFYASQQPSFGLFGDDPYTEDAIFPYDGVFVDYDLEEPKEEEELRAGPCVVVLLLSLAATVGGLASLVALVRACRARRQARMERETNTLLQLLIEAEQSPVAAAPVVTNKNLDSSMQYAAL